MFFSFPYTISVLNFMLITLGYSQSYLRSSQEGKRENLSFWNISETKKKESTYMASVWQLHWSRKGKTDVDLSNSETDWRV